jgi:hypothetical protein
MGNAMNGCRTFVTIDLAVFLVYRVDYVNIVNIFLLFCEG